MAVEQGRWYVICRLLFIFGNLYYIVYNFVVYVFFEICFCKTSNNHFAFFRYFAQPRTNFWCFLNAVQNFLTNNFCLDVVKNFEQSLCSFLDTSHNFEQIFGVSKCCAKFSKK